MYSFKHALTQDVAYASLLERRRRVYHGAVGAGLEDIHAGRIDEVVELLAHHFGRSAEGDKAVDYAILAGEKAQRSWANKEALEQFEAALKRVAAMPGTQPNRLRRIDAVVKQAEIKFALGRHAEHVHALEEIKDLVETAADPPRRASWYYWTGFLHSLTGSRAEVSAEYCLEAAAIAEAAGLDEIRSHAECALAHVLMAAGDSAGAIAAGERALAAFEARENHWWACRALWALIPAVTALGHWDRALGYCRRGQEHAQALNDLRLKIVAWYRIGWVHIRRGDVTAGLRCCEEALALGPTAFDAAFTRAAHGYGVIKAGDIAAGLAEAGEAVAWFEQAGLRYTRAFFAMLVGEERARAARLLEPGGSSPSSADPAATALDHAVAVGRPG